MGHITSLTETGQITLPDDVRDELKLKPFDEVEIIVENGAATVRKANLTLQDVAGSIPAAGLPWEEVRRIAHEEVAERYAKKFPR